MTLHEGDCLDVMAAMEPESVDAVVTDPPYGLEFMGKAWDKFRVDDPGTARNRGQRAGDHGDKGSVDERWGGRGRSMPSRRLSYGGGDRPTTSRCTGCGKRDQWRNAHECIEGAQWKSLLIDPHAAPPTMLALQEWSWEWAREAYRVAKPSAYLLAFGGTRTVHRMTVAIEDAGWIIRDMLVWAYASGFPKSKASLKPAWEPIVMARKPGPLRELAIDACRIPGEMNPADYDDTRRTSPKFSGIFGDGHARRATAVEAPAGRWPANVILTDPIFDGGWDGVVGGGVTAQSAPASGPTWEGPSGSPSRSPFGGMGDREPQFYGDSGTYSRFFLIPKADRADREPVLGGLSGLDARQQRASIHADPDATWADKNPNHPRRNHHPTVKPVDLMRHLVRLVTPPMVTVLYCPVCEGERERYVPTVRGNGDSEAESTVLLDGVSGNRGTGSGQDVPDLRDDVLGAGSNVGPNVLLAPMRERGAESAGPDVSGVRGFVSGSPHGTEDDPLLLADVRGAGLRADEASPDGQPGRLHLGVEPDPPERDALGLRDAAPPDHGRGDGASAGGGRGGRSHQRDQGRQPQGEPAGTDEAGARQPAEAGAEAHRVSALPRDPSDLGPCPVCRSPLAARSRRGLVLDPFAGSGSTLLAAEMEGFEWIGVEKEAEYVAIAEARLNGTQRGLGLPA